MKKMLKPQMVAFLNPRKEHLKPYESELSLNRSLTRVTAD